MARKIGHILHDILEAIERIEHATRGKTLQEFESSWEMRWLVQRGIEIVSEASRGIPDAAKSQRPEIPWKQVAGIGNVLRHDYSGLADRIIWGVVHDELPKLKKAIKAISATIRE
jgi:uncharacterized protein with HEPN domain